MKQTNIIARATFANGESFEIAQLGSGPACAIKNLRTGAVTRAGSEAKAWSSVRFMARVGQATEYTPGVVATGSYHQQYRRGAQETP